MEEKKGVLPIVNRRTVRCHILRLALSTLPAWSPGTWHLDIWHLGSWHLGTWHLGPSNPPAASAWSPDLLLWTPGFFENCHLGSLAGIAFPLSLNRAFAWKHIFHHVLCKRLAWHYNKASQGRSFPPTSFINMFTLKTKQECLKLQHHCASVQRV